MESICVIGVANKETMGFKTNETINMFLSNNFPSPDEMEISIMVDNETGISVPGQMLMSSLKNAAMELNGKVKIVEALKVPITVINCRGNVHFGRYSINKTVGTIVNSEENAAVYYNDKILSLNSTLSQNNVNGGVLTCFKTTKQLWK